VRLAADAGNDIVDAILSNSRSCQRALAFSLAFSADQQEEALARICEVKPDGLLLRNKRVELRRLGLNGSRETQQKH
jgi:hypothetical protein